MLVVVIVFWKWNKDLRKVESIDITDRQIQWEPFFLTFYHYKNFYLFFHHKTLSYYDKFHFSVFIFYFSFRHFSLQGTQQDFGSVGTMFRCHGEWHKSEFPGKQPWQSMISQTVERSWPSEPHSLHQVPVQIHYQILF